DRAKENANNDKGNGKFADGQHPGQGIYNRSDRANEVAQNVAKNKHLQHLVTDPDSPWYGDGQINGDDSGDGKNCDTINAGCTAGQTEIDQYTGEEVVVIGPADDQLFYYHPDHLGSTAYITDQNGDLKEHLEYFPFGETWVQEGGSKKTPYLYTSKEFDSETGLYYYGARYYDPRTSLWVSADPILEKYLPNVSDLHTALDAGEKYKPEESLKGMGGVFNASNMNLYHYSALNPVRYTDPDGNSAVAGVLAGLGADLATPEPTDAVPIKWLGWAGAIAGAGLIDLVMNNDSDTGEEKSPSLPNDLVGVQDDKAGQQGNRHKSGPLATENGGTGDAGKDFDKLTGGKSSPGTGKLDGAKVGDNGIILRPGKEGSGPRIDIPANGDKPHETLHYD
ncbi:MAG: hypothetical protein OEV64_14485, partial [Desulfobulbaceae bacterium]|nr:hypothetical protein [Desulfobulbaceae bacterium]